MVPTRVPRKPFDALAYQARGPWRIVRTVMLILLLTALLPLAYASPIDTTWIEGFYDAGDSDDVVGLVMDATGTHAELKPARLVEYSVACALPSETDNVPHWTLLAKTTRAPPPVE